MNSNSTACSCAGAGNFNKTLSFPRIDRLTGKENWHTWKFALQTLLELEDLWGAVQPKQNDDGTYEAVDARMDRKARAYIILHLDPVNYVYAKKATTAREVWEKLEKTFGGPRLTKQIELMDKMFKTDLSTCESMADYVNQTISTAHQLNENGLETSDKLVGLLLLARLPDSYDPWAKALESSGVTITAENVKTKLLQEAAEGLHKPSLGPNKKSENNSNQSNNTRRPKNRT